MLCYFFLLIFDLCNVVLVEYENYYPRNKKEIPEGSNHKSEAKGIRELTIIYGD